MRVLLTGATGFLGRNLLEAMLRIAPQVHIECLVRQPDLSPWLQSLPSHVTVLQADLTQPSTLNGLSGAYDAVFHVAAKVSLTDGADFYAINTQGTANLLAALKDCQVNRFVYVSSIAAVDRPATAKPPFLPLTHLSTPNPQTDYGQSKRQAEQWVEASGLDWTILRPAYITGPYLRPGSTVDKVIRDLAKAKLYTRFPYTGQVSAMYAPDLAEWIWHAAFSPNTRNQAFFAAHPDPLTVRSAFKVISQGLKMPYQAYPCPKVLLPWLKRLMVREGLSPLLAQILFEGYFVCDAKPLADALRKRPSHTPEAALMKTVRWLQEHAHLPERRA